MKAVAVMPGQAEAPAKQTPDVQMSIFPAAMPDPVKPPRKRAAKKIALTPLQEQEEIIDQWVSTTADVARAIRTIHKDGLWSKYGNYGTWAEYVETRWEFGVRRADQLRAAIDVVDEIGRILPKIKIGHAEKIIELRRKHGDELVDDVLEDIAKEMTHDPLVKLTAAFIKSRVDDEIARRQEERDEEERERAEAAWAKQKEAEAEAAKQMAATVNVAETTPDPITATVDEIDQDEDDDGITDGGALSDDVAALAAWYDNNPEIDVVTRWLDAIDGMLSWFDGGDPGSGDLAWFREETKGLKDLAEDLESRGRAIHRLIAKIGKS